ncbi:MAG TPA: succinate dehydrogenase, hydrophobic membrane anchor protein [Xanthobacteraceae bacterium]|jgi:succinate dehydrogenase / fumarate reductase membrane anchor subunit
MSEQPRHMPSQDMRTPMRRVRGLGSARSGTSHFWHQRLTSVAAIPLTIAFLAIMISLVGRNHAAAVQILASPLVAITMLLFVLNTVYHMWLGMQVVIEDYVHHEIGKLCMLMANTFFCIAVGLACAYALLKLSFGV